MVLSQSALMALARQVLTKMGNSTIAASSLSLSNTSDTVSQLADILLLAEAMEAMMRVLENVPISPRVAAFDIDWYALRKLKAATYTVICETLLEQGRLLNDTDALAVIDTQVRMRDVVAEADRVLHGPAGQQHMRAMGFGEADVEDGLCAEVEAKIIELMDEAKANREVLRRERDGKAPEGRLAQREEYVVAATDVVK